MKKVCNAGIFLMLLAVLITVNYRTAYGDDDGFYYWGYETDGEEGLPPGKYAHIWGYTGQEENLVIPDELEGYKVIRVNIEEENTFVKTVTLPSGISESLRLSGLTSLTDIYVSGDSESLFSEDGILYSKYDNIPILMCVPQGRQGSVSVKEGTKEIGYCAFFGCKNVTEVNIPASVEGVDGTAFAFCDGSSMNIKIDERNEYLSIKDGMLCDKQGKSLIVYLPADLDTVTIPDYINRICTEAFSSYFNINKIIISSSNTQLDPYAFSDCLAQEIVLPEGMKKIPFSAFAFCDNLNKINIPSTVTEIEQNAFAYCISLEEITIPENVTIIGEMAFRTTSLKNIYIESRNIREIGDAAFCSVESSVNIYVHDENTYNMINGNEDISYNANVILVKDAEPLELDKYNVTLYTGNSKKSATVKAVLTGIKGNVKWTTSDKSVATVKNGKITAVKKGRAVVTASVSGHKKKVSVTVKNPTITVVDGSESINTIKVKKGKTEFYRISVNPAKSGVKAVINKNSKKFAKITLKNNTLSVKGIKKGTFTFKLQSGKGSKTVKVKVV